MRIIHLNQIDAIQSFLHTAEVTLHRLSVYFFTGKMLLVLINNERIDSLFNF
jgi:hypothetical protein